MSTTQTTIQAQGKKKASSAALLSEQGEAIRRLAQTKDPIVKAELSDEVKNLGVLAAKALRLEQQASRQEDDALEASVSKKLLGKRHDVDAQLARCDEAKRVLGEAAAVLRRLQAECGDIEIELTSAQRLRKRHEEEADAAIAEVLLDPETLAIRHLVSELDLDPNGGYKFANTIRCASDRGFSKLEVFMNGSQSASAKVFAELRRRREGSRVDPSITLDDQ